MRIIKRFLTLCQILPIGYRQQIKRRDYLANPLAVNYDRYLQQLEDAIELYKRLVSVCCVPRKRQKMKENISGGELSDRRWNTAGLQRVIREN